MHMSHQTRTANPAVVARHIPGREDIEEYLVVAPSGAWSWTADCGRATAFVSMREATRAALRLSAAVRAFGLPVRRDRAACAVH